MKFISKKFSNERFNFLDLLNVEGKIKKIYIASAYCETDVIYKIKNYVKEQISASGCDFSIFIDKYANNAWLGQELISKFRRLNTKLKKEMSSSSEIYFVENKGKLFHSKILFIETTKCIKIFIGSMNFTERGVSSDENEEVLFEFEKDISINNKFITEIINYFKKLKEISLPLSEQNNLTVHNYSSARDFFLSGQVFFEFANSRFFNFSLRIPDEIKKGISSVHSSLVDIVQDNIDVVKMVCSIERQSSRQSWKRYTVETPYGYWAPKEFLDSIFEILDEKSSFKAETVKILEKLANKNEVENVMLPYFQELSDSIHKKFPNCGWDHDKLITRWNDWYKKLIKKIDENNTDGELNLILERYISGISWCSLPDFWDDAFLRENFELCFLDSIEAKGYFPRQTNKFVKFLKSNYVEYPFEDFREFEKILKDKEFSKKLGCVSKFFF